MSTLPTDTDMDMDWHAAQHSLTLTLNFDGQPDYAQLQSGPFLATWQDPLAKQSHALLIPFLIVHFCISPSPDGTQTAGSIKITNNAQLPRAIRNACMHLRTLMTVHGLFLSHAMGPLLTPKLLEYASRFGNSGTATVSPDKWLIVHATRVLTCTHDQPHTLPAFPAGTTMTDLAITLTLIHALYHLPLPPHLPLTHSELAATLFPILVLTYPYRLIDPLTADWLLPAYRTNRSAVRPVIRAAMLGLGAVAPSAAWRVAQHLRSAAMLPALTMELAVRFAHACETDEDGSVVVDLADAVLSANPRAVARDLLDSAGDPVVLAGAGVPSGSAAHVLAQFLTNGLLSRTTAMGHVDRLVNARLLALLAGMIPQLVSFANVQLVTNTLLQSRPTSKQKELSTYLACLAFATLISLASPQSVDNDDGKEIHWTRASLAALAARLPPLATLVHLATSSSSSSSASTPGPSGWAAAEHAWCTWLHISPPLPGLLGGGTMAGDRLLKWTSWVAGDLAARDVVVGASAGEQGVQVELMAALVREHRMAGPEASARVLEYLLAVDGVMCAADVKLVEVFVDAGVMSGVCPPLNHAAVQSHITNSLTLGDPDDMPLSAVLLTYYVLMLTTRLGPWAHSAHFPVEFVHALPVPRALRRARGTHVEYKLRASLGVVGEYLALMQAVDCSGFIDDDQGEESEEDAISVQELIAGGRVGQWTRKLALDPIHVAHQTLATLCLSVPSWPDLLANPLSLFTWKTTTTAYMFATASLANMSLLTLDFLLASSASLVRSRAVRAFGTYIDAQQREHDVGKLEWQVGEAVASVKAAVINAVAECVLLGGARGGADDVVLGWMNRMYMKDGMLVGRCVGLGVDPRMVPRLVKLTSFHVFLQQFASTLPSHPHLTLYLLAALCYEYPLPETLQLATKQLVPMLPAMFASSLDAGQLGVPLGSDMYETAATRLTRFDVVLKAVVEVVRAFPEDVAESVQTILLETKQALTQQLMHVPNAHQRAILIQCYDGLMETVEEVMRVARKGVMHCGR